jgi:hypothetical protein
MHVTHPIRSTYQQEKCLEIILECCGGNTPFLVHTLPATNYPFDPDGLLQLRLIVLSYSDAGIGRELREDDRYSQVNPEHQENLIFLTQG